MSGSYLWELISYLWFFWPDIGIILTFPDIKKFKGWTFLWAFDKDNLFSQFMLILIIGSDLLMINGGTCWAKNETKN